MLATMTLTARIVAATHLPVHGTAIAAAPPDCQATVASTLRGIAQRVYHQAATGRVVSGSKANVERSTALAAAVAQEDPAAVRAALKPLLRASIKRIVISSDGRVLA